MIFLSQENTRSLAADFSAFGCLGSFQIAIDCHRLPEAVEFANTALRWAWNELSSTNVLSKGQRHQRRQLEKIWKETPGNEGASFGALDAMLCLSSPNRKNVTLGAVPTSCPCSQGCASSELEYVGIWPGDKSQREGLHNAGSRTEFRL